MSLSRKKHIFQSILIYPQKEALYQKIPRHPKHWPRSLKVKIIGDTFLEEIKF